MTVTDQQLGIPAGDSSYFYNGQERVKNEYVPGPGDMSVTKLPWGRQRSESPVDECIVAGQEPSVIGYSERRRLSRRSGGRSPKQAGRGSRFA